MKRRWAGVGVGAAERRACIEHRQQREASMPVASAAATIRPDISPRSA